MNVAQETLGFRRQGLSPCLSLLMSAFALPISPAALPSHLHRRTERSSTAAANPSKTLAVHHDCLVMESFCDSSDAQQHAPRRKTRWQMCLKDLQRPAASVIGLSPVTSSAQDDSISELLRFL